MKKNNNKVTLGEAKVLCYELYQICSAYKMDSKILDNLSVVSKGLKPIHKDLLSIEINKQQEELSFEDEKTYFQIALRMVGININKCGVEIVLRLYKENLKKGDGLSIKDIITIQYNIEEKYRIKEEHKKLNKDDGDENGGC